MSSDAIFAEIGRHLRARREMLSLTHEEIERHTHVRVSFLKALEAGELEGLPSPVQTRGILANYAAFIDLDADAHPAALRGGDSGPAPRAATAVAAADPFPHDGAQQPAAAARLHRQRSAVWRWGSHHADPFRRVGYQSGGDAEIRPAATGRRALHSGGAGTSRGAHRRQARSRSSLPRIRRWFRTLEVATQEAPTPIDPSITVQVKLSATERTYLRVLVDDRPAFEGRTEPGKDYYYQAARQIEVLAGNAAALRVTHNGTDRGTLGGYGQVVDQLYTSRGVFTPTPTMPPTATASATPTATLRATPTLATFTPTPRTGE